MPTGIYPHKQKPIEERFWAKIEKSPSCWNWQASLDKHGYGQLMRDSMSKGRNIRGEKFPQSKLTKLAVKDIRQRYESGFFSQTILGKEYHVTASTISRVVNGKMWEKKE